MVIDFSVEPEFSKRIRRRELTQAALTALRAEQGPASKGLTIVIVGDRTIRALNRRYVGINSPTDVLSFSYDDKDQLGDIVISYETARSNSRRFHSTIRVEMRRLAIHGVLHLLGYDDHTRRGRNRMWKRQEEILTAEPSGARSSIPRARTQSESR